MVLKQSHPECITLYVAMVCNHNLSRYIRYRYVNTTTGHTSAWPSSVYLYSRALCLDQCPSTCPDQIQILIRLCRTWRAELPQWPEPQPENNNSCAALWRMVPQITGSKLYPIMSRWLKSTGVLIIKYQWVVFDVSTFIGWMKKTDWKNDMKNVISHASDLVLPHCSA